MDYAAAAHAASYPIASAEGSRIFLRPLIESERRPSQDSFHRTGYFLEAPFANRSKNRKARFDQRLRRPPRDLL